MSRLLRIHWIVALLGLAGCASTEMEDRVRFFNADGLAMFSQGKFHQASESFTLALELSPNDADLLFNLGQCHDRLGSIQSTEEYYLLCLRKSAGHSPARYALGKLYYKTGRRAEALDLIAEWFREQPNSAEPYALDGWRLLQEQNHPAAMDRLRQALSKEQDNVHALTELAVLYEILGKPDRAAVQYERALARNPNQAEITKRLLQASSIGIGPPSSE